MDKPTIIDFVAYRNRRVKQEDVIPEDLVTAIELLIERLRDAKPLKQSG